jgi:alcohol dehydrogenase
VSALAPDAIVGSFNNLLPVNITFACGALDKLADIAEQERAQSIVVVSDAIISQLVEVQSALTHLSADGRTVQVILVPAGEPTIDSVDAVGEQLREIRPDLVVAIGGGSVLDSAKGGRLLLANPGSIRTYSWPGTPAPIVPGTTRLITVPTTSGTGSEVTGGVVMTDPENGMKVAAPSPHNRANYCLVDPRLTVSLPPGPTLWGGLDALGQAIGSVVCAAHTPVGDALGLEAIRLAVAALPAVLASPTDLDARASMSCAALLAGLAMNVSEAGTEHSLAHALGTTMKLPHGLTVGAMLLESMEHDRQYVPHKFERVADAMGAPQDGTGDGTRALRAVEEFLAAVNCPTLSELNVTEDQLAELTNLARAGWIPVEPGPWTDDDVRSAFSRALARKTR